MDTDTDIVKRGTVTETVQAYNEARELIEKGYKLLAEAEDKLKAAFMLEKYTTSMDVLPGHYDRTSDPHEAPALVLGRLQRAAWQNLYDRLEIKRVMSIQRSDETEKKLREGELPPLTVDAIFETFELLHANVDTFARESVQEIFEWIRPHEGYSDSQYKTNQKNARVELGKKVIHGYMVQVNYSRDGYRVNYHNEKYLIALDRVFHMLEGTNMLDKSYRSPLVDAINQSDHTGRTETEYFKVRCFMNGNLHIEFKRMDLVKKFNAMVGGMNLKPAN